MTHWDELFGGARAEPPFWGTICKRFRRQKESGLHPSEHYHISFALVTSYTMTLVFFAYVHLSSLLGWNAGIRSLRQGNTAPAGCWVMQIWSRPSLCQQNVDDSLQLSTYYPFSPFSSIMSSHILGFFCVGAPPSPNFWKIPPPPPPPPWSDSVHQMASQRCFQGTLMLAVARHFLSSPVVRCGCFYQKKIK